MTGRPRVHAFFLQHLYPRPDLVLYLDAPPELLFARKGEGTLESLAALRADYQRLAEVTPHFVTLDASEPLELVVKQAAEAINLLAEHPRNTRATDAQRAVASADRDYWNSRRSSRRVLDILLVPEPLRSLIRLSRANAMPARRVAPRARAQSFRALRDASAKWPEADVARRKNRESCETSRRAEVYTGGRPQATDSASPGRASPAHGPIG